MPTHTTSVDRARIAVVETHLEKIVEVTDDLRRLEPSGRPLRDLVERLGLHAAEAQEELDTLWLDLDRR